MPCERADAHMHLFSRGYQGGSFASRPGVRIDEAQCYASLARERGVEAALVVGYEGEPWCTENNAHIAEMAGEYTWVRPMAYVDVTQSVDQDMLERWRKQGFVGIGVYVFDARQAAGLARVMPAVWRWLVEHDWMVSVNSAGEWLAVWHEILEEYPQLQVLISHLGLPKKVASPPSGKQAARTLAPLLALSRFAQTYVKLSGFYAISDPSWDYPHAAAWPYVQAVYEAFGCERLLWGSDFSPHLDSVSFAQTLGVFEEMPFFSTQQRAMIEGANLLKLLRQVAR